MTSTHTILSIVSKQFYVNAGNYYAAFQVVTATGFGGQGQGLEYRLTPISIHKSINTVKLSVGKLMVNL